MGNVCTAKKEVQKVDASYAQQAGETLPLLNLDEAHVKREPDRGGGGFGAMPMDDRRHGDDRDSKRSSRRGRHGGKHDKRSKKGEDVSRRRDDDDVEKKKPAGISSFWKFIYKMIPYLIVIYITLSIFIL
jgi:hypothetical protein